MTGKIYGYARVSTEDQTLDVQKAALEAAGCQVVMLETASGASRLSTPPRWWQTVGSIEYK
jgi:DNA invertase Pin-like site-specific DNA recombinase